MRTPEDSPSPIAPEEWERIARFITGEADASELADTKRWLESDSRRSETVSRLQSLLMDARGERPTDVDVESALRRVKSRFGADVVSLDEHRVGQHRFTTAAYVKAAAIAVILIGSGIMWQKLNERAANGTAKTYATAIGERRDVSLVDGSHVVLGPVSTLRFSVEDDGERTAELTGDGYFSVLHDANRPFVVRIAGASVRDVGTSFSVRSDESGAVRVSVDSGSVMLGDSVESMEGAVLKAGDRATLDPKGVAQIDRGSVSEDDRAWTQGHLVFRDSPLIEVATELYRWYGVRLRVADSSLVNLHLTASFSGEPVDRVLNVIALSLGAHVERQGNVAILRRSNNTIPGRR